MRHSDEIVDTGPLVDYFNDFAVKTVSYRLVLSPPYRVIAPEFVLRFFAINEPGNIER